MKCIDKGLDNNYVFSFVIYIPKEKDSKAYIVVSKGVMDYPRDNRRSGIAMTSSISEDK